MTTFELFLCEIDRLGVEESKQLIRSIAKRVIEGKLITASDFQILIDNHQKQGGSQLLLNIRLTSAPFEDQQKNIEVARILRETADKIEDIFPWLGLKLRDINGTVVGEVIIRD